MLLILLKRWCTLATRFRTIGSGVSIVQETGGLSVGIAMGELDIVRLRPFSRTHLDAIGEMLNIGARLTDIAGSNEIVVSNAYYQNLQHRERTGFEAIGPVEARNIAEFEPGGSIAPQYRWDEHRAFSFPIAPISASQRAYRLWPMSGTREQGSLTLFAGNADSFATAACRLRPFDTRCRTPAACALRD
jgi:hypothetical protein